jgi:hypothetical protein
MAIITLTFNHDINVSVQLDDLVYYVPTNPVGIPNSPTGSPWESTTTPHDSNTRENVVLIGPVTGIMPWDGNVTMIFADMDDDLILLRGIPSDGDFIMFSKDNKVNLSSLLGYYSKVKLANSSEEQAELFAIGADWVESSK